MANTLSQMVPFCFLYNSKEKNSAWKAPMAIIVFIKIKKFKNSTLL